ncbi:hypothetical protein R1flu_016979 [Riccia fluitans]|uniref:Uncharacterized protein n=1 Tax=Riccia fluitans TaxID=41844 RepID=A0ABD1YNN6_9MARC
MATDGTYDYTAAAHDDDDYLGSGGRDNYKTSGAPADQSGVDQYPSGGAHYDIYTHNPDAGYPQGSEYPKAQDNAGGGGGVQYNVEVGMEWNQSQPEDPYPPGGGATPGRGQPPNNRPPEPAFRPPSRGPPNYKTSGGPADQSGVDQYPSGGAHYDIYTHNPDAGYPQGTEYPKAHDNAGGGGGVPYNAEVGMEWNQSQPEDPYPPGGGATPGRGQPPKNRPPEPAFRPPSRGPPSNPTPGYVNSPGSHHNSGPPRAFNPGTPSGHGQIPPRPPSGPGFGRPHPSYDYHPPPSPAKRPPVAPPPPFPTYGEPHIRPEIGPPVPWASEIFGFLEDCYGCPLVLIAPCVTFGQIAEIVDTGYSSFHTAAIIYALALFMGIPCLYSFSYRTRMRHRFNLRPDPLDDFFTHLFCEVCALSQEYRELRYRGIDPSLGYNMQRDLINRAMEAPVPPRMEGRSI